MLSVRLISQMLSRAASTAMTEGANRLKPWDSIKLTEKPISSMPDSRISSATRLKTTNERLIASAQKNVDTWSKNMLTYPKNPTEVQKKQIATVQAGFYLNKQRVIDATANIV